MALFKLFSVGVLSAAVITHVQANGTDGCTFSLSASGGIECPAGQLSDGQIRLNGSYPTAQFTIRGDKIWDPAGRGCIVTAAPITQIQCDLNAAPAPGFSIDSSNKLLFQGSSQFYACPATDTQYNVYVKPDFGQTKCFAVTLTASGCGSAPPTSAPSCPNTQLPSTVTETTTCTITQAVTVPGPASTITVPGSASTVTVPGPVSTISVSGPGSTTTETTTCTVADVSTITSMGTVTSTVPCTSSSSSSSSKICHKCQSMNSTTTSSSVCHKCTGTGTGGHYPTGRNSTWSKPLPTGMTTALSSSSSSMLW